MTVGTTFGIDDLELDNIYHLKLFGRSQIRGLIQVSLLRKRQSNRMSQSVQVICIIARRSKIDARL